MNRSFLFFSLFVVLFATLGCTKSSQPASEVPVETPTTENSGAPETIDEDLGDLDDLETDDLDALTDDLESDF